MEISYLRANKLLWDERTGERLLQPAHRFYADHYTFGLEVGVPLAPLKQDHQDPQCEHPLGYFNPVLLKCEICENHAGALIECACILLRIPVLKERPPHLHLVGRAVIDEVAGSRLIFADILDEHGYPEGELIRVQEEILALEAQLNVLRIRRDELKGVKPFGISPSGVALGSGIPFAHWAHLYGSWDLQ